MATNPIKPGQPQKPVFAGAGSNGSFGSSLFRRPGGNDYGGPGGYGGGTTSDVYGTPTTGTELQRRSQSFDAGGQSRNALGIPMLPTELQRRTYQTPSTGGDGMGTAGDFISEAFAKDYERMNGARSDMRNQLQGVIGGIDSVMGRADGMVGDAQRRGDQQVAIGREGLNKMQEGAAGNDALWEKMRGRNDAANAQARKDMQGGVDTMRKAVADMDFFRKDAVAGGVAGIQGQFQSAKEQINSDPNMTPEAKQMALANLNQTMHQQSSAFAAQADQQASQALMQSKAALGQMQMQLGSQMGQMEQAGNQMLSYLGVQGEQQKQQATQAGYGFLASQSQFAAGLSQSAQAQAIQAGLSGNGLKAQVIEQVPFGAASLAETVIRMFDAQRMQPGSRVGDSFGSRIGGLMDRMV